MAHTLRSPDCDCPTALHYADGLSGGDAGGTFNGGFTVRSGYTAALEITVDAFTQKDGFDIYVDGGLVLGTGCIAGSAGYSATVGSGAHTVQVVVAPDCEAIGPGTIWQIDVTADEDRC